MAESEWGGLCGDGSGAYACVRVCVCACVCVRLSLCSSSKCPSLVRWSVAVCVMLLWRNICVCNFIGECKKTTKFGGIG